MSDDDGSSITKELNAELRAAIGEGSFLLNFHPILDGASGRPTAVEALLRWRLQDGRTVSPAVVLAVARDQQLLREINLWTIHAAADAARSIYARHGVPVGVNLDSDAGAPGVLSDMLADALRACDLPTAALAVEVTELSLANAHAEEEVRALSDAGHEIFIDDFRVGAASMARLRDLRPSGLKTERAMVMRVDENIHVATSFQAALRLAQSYDLPLIAKGVERTSEFHAVCAYGAAGVQGFLFGRPSTLDDVMDSLNEGPDPDLFGAG